MEENNLLSADMQVDALCHAHLTESAKWAKFVAIAGFIFSGAILFFAFYYINLVSEMNRYRSYYATRDNSGPMLIAAFYVITSIIWAVTSVFQFRFASRLLTALQGNDQDEFQRSLFSFKMYYRMCGAVTIICLFLLFLGIIGILNKGTI